MTITLYDLAGADPAARFSPHCWRARMALAHKGLDVDTISWRFTDKDAIAFSGQGLVPVLCDGDRTVTDSWAIARYLDEAYPDRPPLLAGDQATAHALFIKLWCEHTLQPGIIKQILPELFDMLAEQDKDYFRETRTRRWGMSLEQFAVDADDALPGFRRALSPMRATLKAQDYLGGAEPSFADYIVFGAFQWARVSSARALLEADDPIVEWRQRLLDRFDGLAARTPAREQREPRP